MMVGTVTVHSNSDGARVTTNYHYVVLPLCCITTVLRITTMLCVTTVLPHPYL